MNELVRITVVLRAPAEQLERLEALQRLFAKACNAISPRVRESRVWNRVAMHHLYYREIRNRFPALGSQMACNAIYSVSRACRMVYQHPASPFNLARLGGRPLPLVRFSDECPVYFDRHTVSLRDGQLSLFSLDGRTRFRVSLKPEDERALKEGKSREIVLSRRRDGVFQLSFWLVPGPGVPVSLQARASVPESVERPIPAYVLIEEAA